MNTGLDNLSKATYKKKIPLWAITFSSHIKTSKLYKYTLHRLEVFIYLG